MGLLVLIVSESADRAGASTNPASEQRLRRRRNVRQRSGFFEKISQSPEVPTSDRRVFRGADERRRRAMYAANDYSRLKTDIRGSTEAVVARSHQAAVQIRLVGQAGIERFSVRIFNLAGVALLWTAGRLLSSRRFGTGFFRHAATAKDSDQHQTPRILSHQLTLAPWSRPSFPQGRDRRHHRPEKTTAGVGAGVRPRYPWPRASFADSRAQPGRTPGQAAKTGQYLRYGKNLPCIVTFTRSPLGSGRRSRLISKSIALMIPSPNSSWISSFQVLP